MNLPTDHINLHNLLFSICSDRDEPWTFHKHRPGSMPQTTETSPATPPSDDITPLRDGRDGDEPPSPPSPPSNSRDGDEPHSSPRDQKMPALLLLQRNPPTLPTSPNTVPPPNTPAPLLLSRDQKMPALPLLQRNPPTHPTSPNTPQKVCDLEERPKGTGLSDPARFQNARALSTQTCRTIFSRRISLRTNTPASSF